MVTETVIMSQRIRPGTKPFRRALLFWGVEGPQSPFVSNFFASRRRLARIVGLEEVNLVPGWSGIASQRIKPELVAEAPVKDVVLTGTDIDVRQFPIPAHFETDGGRYVSSGVVIAKG